MMRDQIYREVNGSVSSNISRLSSTQAEPLTIKNQTQPTNISIVYKIVVAVCFVTGYTIYRIFYVPFDNSVCIVDLYFQATFNANRGLLNGVTANAILGIAQVIMDGWIIFLGSAWLVLIKNMRFPISAGVLYLFRSFFLTIQKLPFDEYIVWFNPGFLSFTVPYDRTRDFFFSGHTSILTIITIELFLIKWYCMGVFAFLSLIYMMNILIITRIHYTIDIMAALIFSIVIYRLIVMILKYVDYFFSIPFYVVRYGYSKWKKTRVRREGDVFVVTQTEQEIIRRNNQIE